MSKAMWAISLVSDVCQINEVDHHVVSDGTPFVVSDVCQINEVDH